MMAGTYGNRRGPRLADHACKRAFIPPPDHKYVRFLSWPSHVDRAAVIRSARSENGKQQSSLDAEDIAYKI